MKQDGHSDILSLLIAGFDLAFVCAFGWGSEVWQRQSRRKANSTTMTRYTLEDQESRNPRRLAPSPICSYHFSVYQDGRRSGDSFLLLH